MIRLDIVELKGVDGEENYVAAGEGMDPENAYSVLFNHSNIHFGVDFFLHRLNVRNDSIWIQLHQRRIFITFSFNITLSESGKNLNSLAGSTVNGRKDLNYMLFT